MSRAAKTASGSCMFQEMSNFASLLRSAGELRRKMEAIAEDLRSRRVVGTAGAGMVQVEVNGLGEVLRVTIEPALVERGDREMIEDLLPAAVNQAIAKAKELHLELTKSATEGLSIPGLDEALAKFMPK
jgi:nucleoid-associated protein EbfC